MIPVSPSVYCIGIGKVVLDVWFWGHLNLSGLSLCRALNPLVSLFGITISSEYLKTGVGGTFMVLTRIICVPHSIRK